VRRQQRGTYLPAGNPYLPFIAAICAHIVVAALIVILPSIAIQHPPEQIITVNLADMPAPAVSGAKGGGPPPKPEDKPQAKPEPPQPPPEPTKIEATAVKKKPEPPPEPPPPPPPPPPPKVVSLKPTQVKKVPPEPPPKETVKKQDDQAVKREMDKIREQLSKEKQRQEVNRLRQQLAQEDKLRDQRKRDQAAAEARAADAEAQRLRSQLEGLRTQSRLMEAREQGLLGSGRNSQNDNTRNAASSGVDSALANQYYSRIAGQLQSYWKLPDYKDWPASLLAKVIVTIDKSGKILDVQFEKRSGDDAFDRLVRKTLDDADPLPPIPPALKKDRLEIGLNFTPGSITGR